MNLSLLKFPSFSSLFFDLCRGQVKTKGVIKIVFYFLLVRGVHLTTGCLSRAAEVIRHPLRHVFPCALGLLAATLF